jgi:hypothetical protein
MTAFSFTTKARHIENSLQAVGKLRDRAVLAVDEENVILRTVDPSDSFLCEAQIQSGAVTQSRIKGTKSQSEVTIDPSKLEPYLSPADKNDSVTLAYDEDESTIEGRISTQNLEFTLPVHATQLNNIPETGPVEQQISRELNGFDLKQTVKLFSTIFDKDCVEFQAENSTSSALRMIAQNEYGTKISRSFEVMKPPTPGSSNYTDEDVENLSTKIGVDYLSKFEQLFGRSEMVTVHLRDSYPVRFELRLDSDLKITYIIAPRREEE